MLIYMLEDDQVIRDLVLYALRQQTDLEAQALNAPPHFTQRCAAVCRI